jgi:4-amino-4-deoxy-L-arabinose transferase-like glycosyltransferase
MGKKQKRIPPDRRVEPRGRVGSPRPSRRTFVILLVILGVGLVFRALYLFELTGLPDFDHPLVDAHYHDYWARAIVTGDWSPPQDEPDPHISTTPYFRPPGYPFFLAAVYEVFGMGYVVPRIIQMLLGLGSVVLLFALGRRLFDDATALVGAALMAVYWVFVYFEGDFLEPALSVFLIVSFVLVLVRWYDRPSLPAGAAAGLLLGFLCLVRPNALLLIPVAGAWIYWAGRAALSGRRTLATILVLLCGTFVVILPVTIRNYVVSGDFVLISSNAGINLLIGNSARADGEVRGTIPGIGTLDTSFDYPEIVRRVEELEGRPMSDAEVNRYLAGRALRQIASDPGRTVRLMIRKTLLFWGPKEVADNKVIGLDRAHSRVLRAIPLSFPIVLSLALLGLVRVWKDGKQLPGRKRRAATVLIFFVAMVWFASHLPVAVTARYRVPVIPFLILFGAFFLRWAVAAVRHGRARRAWPWLAAAAALLVLTHVNVAGYEDSEARWHYQRAVAFQHGGDLDHAIEEYRLALRSNPQYAAVYNDLAAALANQGRIAESVPYFEKAVQFMPDDASVHLNLAMALEALGRRAESHAHYREALRLSPSSAEARTGLERTRPPQANPPR